MDQTDPNKRMDLQDCNDQTDNHEQLDCDEQLDHDEQLDRNDGSFKKKKRNSGIKRQIRSLERLLEKDNLPADVRRERERALEALRLAHEANIKNLHTQRLAKKYHKVRFFERQKATRNLKKAKTALLTATSTDKQQFWLKRVQFFTVDMFYTRNFPKDEKYLSLYAGDKQSLSEDADSLPKRNDIWHRMRNNLEKSQSTVSGNNSV